MLSSLRDLLSRKKEAEEDIFTEASISSKLKLKYLPVMQNCCQEQKNYQTLISMTN